jgi:hypothetical protein
LDCSGKLNDEQLERLLNVALQDDALLAAAEKLAAHARAVRTANAQRDRSLSDDLWEKARRLALREYPQSEVDDWNELYRQLDAYMAKRWLSDLSLLQHATPVRANAMRWNRIRFHLIAFRSSRSAPQSHSPH